MPKIFLSDKVRGVEHNMPKIWYYGAFSLFHRCRASARLPSQKQKSIRTLCIFGAEQFKTSRFLLEQGTKSPPYCRMARFLTQFKRKYTVLNHIGFDSPHLKGKQALPSNIFRLQMNKRKRRSARPFSHWLPHGQCRVPSFHRTALRVYRAEFFPLLALLHLIVSP